MKEIEAKWVERAAVTDSWCNAWPSGGQPGEKALPRTGEAVRENGKVVVGSNPEAAGGEVTQKVFIRVVNGTQRLLIRNGLENLKQEPTTRKAS